MYQRFHLQQLVSLVLYTLTLHFNDKQQALLLLFPECTRAAMGLTQTIHSTKSIVYLDMRLTDLYSLNKPQYFSEGLS